MIRVILVDDMPKARNMLRMLLANLSDVEIVADFGDAVAAIDFLKETSVDLVFMDIEMPEMNGLEAEAVISTLPNPPKIIFSTAYASYSIRAWGTDAISYIVKPYSLQAIQDAVEKFRRQLQPIAVQPDTLRIEISCFPIFNVFIDGSPIYFKSKKAKELLAFLVHSRGGWTENTDICYNILEDMDEDMAKNNLRTYVKRLKLTLESSGITDLIDQQYGALKVDKTKFGCDYYRYLEGDGSLFSGEYLKEYSWAEPALAAMVTHTAPQTPPTEPAPS